MPGTLNLTDEREIVAYATFDLTIDLVDEVGDPIDLSDFDPVSNPGAGGVRAMFREAVDTPDPPIFDCKDTAVGGAAFPGTGIAITQPPTSGQVRLVIAAAETGTKTQGAATPIDSGVWDMVAVGDVTVPEDYVLALVEGEFAVNFQCTRGF